MPAAIAGGLMVSACTIQKPDGLLIGAGQPSGNWVAIAGLVGIRCMDAPKAVDRLMAQEKKSVPSVESLSYRHVLLSGYYGDMIPWGNPRPQLRAIVTGSDGVPITYDVQGVESDSQETQSRLALHLVTE